MTSFKKDSTKTISELKKVAGGATAATFGSVADGNEPQIPEVLPGAPDRITGQPSMVELNNVTAGATAPGADIGDSGPALPVKPTLQVGANSTAVSAQDAANVAAGATAPGADIGDSGPALPVKPQFQIGPGNVPIQSDNADSI